MAKTYEIHPAIGIARLGKSRDYFIGPEPDGVFPPPIITGAGGEPRSMRDAAGALRPQAARFRVFEVERQGAQLVNAREVKPDEADISWRVHVVNRKAAAPRFSVLGTAQRNLDPALRRNGANNTDDLNDPVNKTLIINPGKQLVNSTSSAELTLKGSYKGQPVLLGRIFPEGTTGRLVFVGGTGISDTVPAGGSLSSSSGDFADNDNWFDDTCDGSVEADLRFKANGRQETARPSWVVSCPYDYAPEITNLVTAYDVLYEVAVDNGLRTIPNPVFYDKHILPILERVMGYQWVNKGAHDNHGRGRPFDFVSSPAWQNLGNPASATGSQQRQQIFPHLRAPGSTNAPVPPEMPLLHSDDFPSDPSVLWLTKVQYGLLQAWANNQFQSKAPTAGPAELVPDALTRMALEACVGRAFWPGIEVSIRIYDRNIFFGDDPFRIAQPGPIQPGLLTQSMSVPWQSDFLDCDREDNAAGIQLNWWPAQRPNDVLPHDQPASTKLWARDVQGGLDMVKRWHLLGIVRRMPTGEQHEIERKI